MRFRRWLWAVTGGVVLCVGIAPPASAAPARSGTILVTYGFTWTGRGCAAAADCFAWQQTGCAAPGAELGGASSIVDVRSLAGSRKKRTFVVTGATGHPMTWGRGITVELLGRGCRELATYGKYDWDRDASYATFRIPKRTLWMTVTAGGGGWLDSSFRGAALKWELR